MNHELQKFYRFILPGAILIATNAITIKDLFGFDLVELKDVNLYILFLGIAAILLGVPLYWIYIIAWHTWFEKKGMQSLEVRWLNDKIPLTNENIENYSHLIWHHIDSDKKYESISNWLRNNFLLIHSLGSSVVAFPIGLIFYLFMKKCSFFYERISLLWVLWFILLFFILLYRKELKHRYLKRLEIFIKVNATALHCDLKKLQSSNNKAAERIRIDGL